MSGTYAVIKAIHTSAPFLSNNSGGGGGGGLLGFGSSLGGGGASTPSLFMHMQHPLHPSTSFPVNLSGGTGRTHSFSGREDEIGALGPTQALGLGGGGGGGGGGGMSVRDDSFLVTRSATLLSASAVGEEPEEDDEGTTDKAHPPVNNSGYNFDGLCAPQPSSSNLGQGGNASSNARCGEMLAVAVANVLRLDQLQLMSSGDPALILSHSVDAWDGHSLAPLSPTVRQKLLEINQQWRHQDLRCIAFAYTPVQPQFLDLFAPPEWVSSLLQAPAQTPSPPLATSSTSSSSTSSFSSLHSSSASSSSASSRSSASDSLYALFASPCVHLAELGGATPFRAVRVWVCSCVRVACA